MSTRREMTKALKDAGYKVLYSYSDPRAHGKRKVIEVALPLVDEEKIAQEDSIPQGPLGRSRGDIWGYMPAHAEEVMSIIQNYYPDAEFDYYRGTSGWLARFKWFEPND